MKRRSPPVPRPPEHQRPFQIQRLSNAIVLRSVSVAFVDEVDVPAVVRQIQIVNERASQAIPGRRRQPALEGGVLAGGQACLDERRLPGRKGILKSYSGRTCTVTPSGRPSVFTAKS